MTDTKALLELAARCEATGADRELDAAIEKAMPCSKRFADNCPHAPRTLWNERAAAYHGARIGDLDDCSEYEPRAYTASLDAAMMLVPEGWSVGIHQQDSGWVVELRRGYNTSYSTVVFSETRPSKRAATPALALCAASLRAIAQEQSK